MWQIHSQSKALNLTQIEKGSKNVDLTKIDKQSKGVDLMCYTQQIDDKSEDSQCEWSKLEKKIDKRGKALLERLQ